MESSNDRLNGLVGKFFSREGKFCSKDPLSLEINFHMIEAALNVGHGNTHEDERHRLNVGWIGLRAGAAQGH